MNKEFVKKMIKAEMLRYEALKDIMPDRLKNRIETFEKEAGNLIKEVALDIISDNAFGADTSEKGTGKKSAKKVQVDFN